MEQEHRNILVDLRRQIIDDVDVYNAIIEPLISEYVLQNEDVERIAAGTTRQRRAEILLNILPSCGPYAFDVFHRALKHHYSWLYNEIEFIRRSRRVNVPDMGRVSPGSPNLPPQPEMTVTREAKMTKLKSALQKLKPGGYLALHGMKGFGKSCLTANTLKDTALVRTAFNNKVYWIKFGCDRSIEDEISIHLNFLYHQVRNSENLNEAWNSGPIKEHLEHYLRSHFVHENNRNALLILDDIWSKKIIDVFDFHCKTLVITTDIDFLDGKHPDVIEMKDGFTETESLGLFAKVLDTKIDQLPPQAKKIHDECNGMPILIAMFAAHFEEFKDDMKIHEKRWQYYLDSLRKKDSTNKVIEKFLAKQEAIFDMCIERLPRDARTKYETLAIFNQDVNIMPKTLEILWDEEPYRVEEHMLDLCHKSLAAKHWNVDLKSYVYGVHDLLLCHLRLKMTPEKLQRLHRDFIGKYEKYCNNDFSKLPDDNYSFSYIGHHLKESKMYEKFPILYTDFDFIREKIYRTGLRDVLIDLKKYRELIIGRAKDGENNVRDLEKFLENQAAVIAEHGRRRCLDLIQIGMNSSTMGYVRQKSVELANARTTKLYVTHDHSSRMHHSAATSEEIGTLSKTAHFTDNENQILIGNNFGEVRLWDCENRTQTVYSGHDRQKSIRKIIVAIRGHFFLTLCDDGQVKFFLLRKEENNDLELNYHLNPVQSPRDKQTYWSGLFGDNTFKDDSRATYNIDGEIITDVALSSDDKRIAVCTDGGTIKVWDIKDGTSHQEKMEKDKFVRVAFTREGSMLHLLDRKNVMTIYAERSEPFAYVTMYNLKIQDREVLLFEALPNNERSLILVGEFVAIYIKWNEICDSKNPKLVEQVCSISKQRRAETQNPNTRFTCATLTYDGQYLVTGDSKGFINVWHIDRGTQPIATFTGRVTSLDTYWLDEGLHMICGSDDWVIHRWTLELEKLPECGISVSRKPLFDAVMKPWDEANIVGKETSDNTIVICHGDKTVAETERIDGEIIRLSLNSEGDKIVYATDKGEIILFDVRTNKSTTIETVTTTLGILSFVNVDDLTVVAWGEAGNLKVSFEKVNSLAENTGNVMAIYTIGKNCVTTVARNGIVKFWSVYVMDWECIKTLESVKTDDTFRHSCMSPNNRSLTILTASGIMIIHTFKIVATDRLQIETDIPAIYDFGEKLSCCDCSQDDNYLAIGLENGEIAIFDVPGRCEVNRLKLHCNKVRQLRWSPNSIGSPILLSVNIDELAWWNVSQLLNKKKPERRSRMGMSRSSTSLGTSPRSSLRLTTSQSLDSEISKAITDNLQALQSLTPTNGDSGVDRNSGVHTVDVIAERYWQNKTPKQSNESALLSVVPLPTSCKSKICVSQDFTKFLSVDVHGSVHNFELYNYK